MAEYTVVITSRAEANIRAINDYIVEKYLDEMNASKTVAAIRRKIYTLSFFPERSNRVEKEPWAGRNTWFVQVKHFKIYYRVNRKTKEVMVLHVAYARRDIDNVLGRA